MCLVQHNVVWCGVVWCGVACCGVVWCGVVWCGVVWCGVVWCGVVWCGVVWCDVVWCGVMWCGVVWCGVVWCGVVWCGVVWCAEGAVTKGQRPGCLPTGKGKRAGLCVLCARCVLVCCGIAGPVHSRTWPTLPCRRLRAVTQGLICPLHPACRAAPPVPSVWCRTAWCSAPHCTVCALLHCCSLPGRSGQWTSFNALHHCLGAVGSGPPATHCLTAGGQWAVDLLQCTAPLPGGSGQRNSCNALPLCPGGSGQWNSCYTLPHCLGAVGSGTPATHCLTALGQWAVELLPYTAALPWGQWAVQLLQYSAALPGGSG